MPEEVFIVIIVGMVVGVPVLGLSLRMVVKPLAEAIGSLKGTLSGPGQRPYDSMESQRLMALEEEVDTLRKVVNRLAEAEEFREQLEAQKAPRLPLATGARDARPAAEDGPPA